MSRTATSDVESHRPGHWPAAPWGALRTLGKSAVSSISSPAVSIPLFLLVVATLLFRITDADMAIMRRFYVDGASEHWPLMDANPWKALYDWGILPAWILGCGGLLVWIASFLWLRLEPWRDAGLYFGLVLALGPGLLVNGLLKPNWGRPRPNNVKQFDGVQNFLPVLEWGHGQEEASFPSGHASMGFYLMVPAFVLYRRRPRLALTFVLLGVTGGAIMGLARVVAGGHFPSDILWAGGCIYFTALALAAPFRFGDTLPPLWKR